MWLYFNIQTIPDIGSFKLQTFRVTQFWKGEKGNKDLEVRAENFMAEMKAQ
jgi:hypothetical protein